MDLHDYITATDGTVVDGKVLHKCTFVSAVCPQLPCYIIRNGKHFCTTWVERIVEADVDIDGGVLLDVETKHSRYLGYIGGKM